MGDEIKRGTNYYCKCGFVGAIDDLEKSQDSMECGGEASYHCPACKCYSGLRTMTSFPVGEFKDIPSNVIEQIAILAFHSKEWITSDIKVEYYPYIPEHYEDADEYFLAKFTGYFAGNHTAEYKVKIFPDWNVYLWYTYVRNNEANVLHVTRNQSKIQELLNPYKNYIGEESKRINKGRSIG